MGIFKNEVTFPQFCEYGFNTWEKHYIPHKNEYTSAAIEAAGLTGKFIPTMEQVNFLWTDLEYLHNYLIMVYAYYYFSGKHSSEDISYVVGQKYVHFLLMGLRKESKASAEKTMDDFIKYFDEIEAKTSNIDDTKAMSADSMATFGVMVLSDRVKTKMPNLDDTVLKYLVQRVWAAGESGYSSAKVVWQ